MNNEIEKTIEVYADWLYTQTPQLMGTLSITLGRGKELFSFEYADSWLKSNNTTILDPMLHFYRGRQYLRSLDKHDTQSNFGIFTDSAPDRWGRRLMQRREAIYARKEKRTMRVLQESDYLLGVDDITRMGALRFKSPGDSDFLAKPNPFSTPPIIRLRELESASRGFEQDEDDEKWLRILLHPGSSLGGARPKATVMDEHADLWIAKFPSTHDAFDTEAWEMVAYRLAEACHLQVVPARLERFSDTGSTFLVKRFDRTATHQRIHFASAMTLLGKHDGASAADGTSYLDIARFIVASASDPDRDLKELWSRLVFSIAVSNTDDHLRNHGFLLEETGWRLSPLYDVNPTLGGSGLSLNISEHDNSADFSLALAQCRYFHLDNAEAQDILSNILTVVASWRTVASGLGIKRQEIELMAPVFKMK
jgi:serine/threonine-protein kinase HipA